MKSKNNNQSHVKLGNLKILNEIKEIFYQNTGMIISFHYPENESEVDIDFYPKNEKSEYCKLIQSNKIGYKRCRQSDKIGLSIAKKNKGFAIYKCHAGLIDIAIPIVYKNKSIGAIYTGQIVTEPQNDTLFSKIYEDLKDLSLSYDKLREAYYKVKYVSPERLRFMVRLLSLLANYIVEVENELFLQKEIIRKNQELYKKEKEKIKLEKELKDLTISILEYRKKKSKYDDEVNIEDIKNNYIISKAQIFIKENYQKSLKLDEVAKAVYLSPNYFSYLFKEKTGYTFSQYLVNIRIEESKKLLENSNLPIKEIVFKSGFNDYNYFNRTFKEVVGVPPGKFRKNK